MSVQLSSIGKRILVFADVHQDANKLEKILSTEKYDMAVCLGDWFDSFDLDTDAWVERTTKLLLKCLKMPNFFTILGNHDIHYFYENMYALSSGFDVKKRKFIHDIIGPKSHDTRDLFQWFLWIDDFLCTHGGLHATHISPVVGIDKEGLSEWLDKQVEISKTKLITGDGYWTYAAGYGRGGRQAKGGLDWLDFNTEFDPIPCLKQIVGHTPGRYIRQHSTEEGDIADWNNICIDCHLSQYLIIQDGKIEIKKYIDL